MKRVAALGLDADTRGVGIVQSSVLSALAYALAVGYDALGLPGGDALSVSIALAWFVLSLVIWSVAFAQAVVRSTRGDEIQVASLFFLQTSAPSGVRVRMLGIAGVFLVITIVTLATNPVGFLANMLPIGWAGLWGARHGTYPERNDPRYTGRTDGRYRQRANQNRRPR